MTRVERAAAGVERLTRGLALLGAAALLAAVAITLADVLLRRIAGTAVIGTVDMIQLCTMAAVFAAIPYAFSADRHVGVDFVLDRLPPRLAAALRGLGAGGAVAVMAAIAWYGWQRAAQQAGYGDSSQTIGIPILWYWAPLLVGAAASAAAAASMALLWLARAAGAAPMPGTSGPP